MKNIIGRFRIFSVPTSPTVALTATATEEEVEGIKENVGLRGNTVVLRASPILNHIKYVKVRRPPNHCGGDGWTDQAGDFHPGLLALLDRIYLGKYVENLRLGVAVKKGIIFCRTELHLLMVYEYLLEMLPQFRDPHTMPFVMNHSGTGKATCKSFKERKDDISLYVTTSKMLMGVNLSNIQVVVFVRPLNMLHYVVQGGGRGGRKEISGKRSKVVVYILYNPADMAGNVPGLSADVREFCSTGDCLKNFLRKYFDNEDKVLKSDWCCNICDSV